jgi:hypothetical protein
MGSHASTVMVFETLPAAPVHSNEYVRPPAAVGLIHSDPVVGRAPVQSPDAEQVVRLVAFHVSCPLSLDARSLDAEIPNVSVGPCAGADAVGVPADPPHAPSSTAANATGTDDGMALMAEGCERSIYGGRVHRANNGQNAIARSCRCDIFERTRTTVLRVAYAMPQWNRNRIADIASGVDERMIAVIPSGSRVRVNGRDGVLVTYHLRDEHRADLADASVQVSFAHPGGHPRAPDDVQRFIDTLTFIRWDGR